MTAPINAALPPDWAFVLQLRQGTSFAAEQLCGRIEHVISGKASSFDSLEEARAFMQRILVAPAPGLP